MNWLEVFERLDCARGGDVPIYARIVEVVRSGIESGQIPDNSRLPTNRELSSLLGVDRSTVSRAYLELEQLGLAESHVGRGTFVRLGDGGLALSGSTEAASAPVQEAMVWADKFSRASQTALSIVGRQMPQWSFGTETISFAGGIPTQEFFPEDVFKDIVASLNRSAQVGDMFSYSPAEGHEGLRTEVRKHLKQQGIVAGDEELLIVSGSQQAIDIVAKTLVDPGDFVLIEEPTYMWANCIFAAAQARCVPVPVDEEGMRVEVIEGILSRRRAKLIYLMPTFQNPTGSTLSLSRRLKLIELARRYQVAILEDNFVGDLRYDGEPLPSLRALDKQGDVVIHQGTFSKALCPGLRLGWLVAPPEVMSRLNLTKRACDLSTNSMAQAIMAEYLRRGHYGRHLDIVRSAYRERRDTMCDALAAHLGDRVQWSKPDGGLFLWAKLPAGSSSRELSTFAEREGVAFSHGDSFFINGDRTENMRLSFIQMDRPTIEEGVQRLSRAVDSYLSSRARYDRAGTAGGRSEIALI